MDTDRERRQEGGSGPARPSPEHAGATLTPEARVRAPRGLYRRTMIRMGGHPCTEQTGAEAAGPSFSEPRSGRHMGQGGVCSQTRRPQAGPLRVLQERLLSGGRGPGPQRHTWVAAGVTADLGCTLHRPGWRLPSGTAVAGERAWGPLWAGSPRQAERQGAPGREGSLRGAKKDTRRWRLGEKKRLEGHTAGSPLLKQP